MTDIPGKSEGFSLSQKRTLLGFLALGALGLSGLLYFLSRVSDSQWGMQAPPLLRIGVILAVFWLAIPNLDRIFSRTPAWLWMATIVAIGLIVFRPWSAIWALPLLVVLWGLSLSWWRKG